MMSTVDGRIILNNWGSQEKTKIFSGLYEKCHGSFKSEAWMVGRVTMEKHFAENKKPRLPKTKRPIRRDVFVGDTNAKSFAIAVDAKGKLRWKSNKIEGDHIIELVTGQVSDAYLQYLQEKRISYIVGGKKQIDFNATLKKLSQFFPIKTIMLEGGGNINGSLLNEGLIDELSLLIVPVADGTTQSPTTFDVSNQLRKKHASPLHLLQVQKLENDVLWLRYRMSSKKFQKATQSKLL